jgi:hypothetical protein
MEQQYGLTAVPQNQSGLRRSAGLMPIATAILLRVESRTGRLRLRKVRRVRSVMPTLEANSERPSALRSIWAMILATAAGLRIRSLRLCEITLPVESPGSAIGLGGRDCPSCAPPPLA